MEEIIPGKEFAVDVYFNENSKPVILNIFEHPFLDSNDVRDRIYITSKKIIQEKLSKFTNILEKIGRIFNFKRFPIHIELIENPKGEVVPVEINPMRFAGWCTTDLAFYAYGINVYEYFEKQIEPNWDESFSRNDETVYYFAMMELPQKIDKNSIADIDYEKLTSKFSKILNLRKVNYMEKPLFAMIFGKTQNPSDIKEILSLDSNEFIIQKY